MQPKTIIIIAGASPELVADVLDLVTGKTAAALAAVSTQTTVIEQEAKDLEAGLHGIRS